MSALRRARLGALFTGAALAAAHAAYAQAPLEHATTVENVVVTGVVAASDRAQVQTSVASIDARRIAETVNAVNVEDALKYLPSIVVRKRHIGDQQAPMATRTSGVGASARSVIYVDGVLLSALIGNNNTSASPRWGMAPAEAIERIEVMYGPFSALYPGNAVGAAVEITTRMPTAFEGVVKAAASSQRFSLYDTHDDYPARELSANVGDRIGDFAWRLSAQHVVSDGQPISLITANRPAAPSASGTRVTGAFADVNRTGAPIVVLGAGGFEHQVQDNQTLKLTYAATPRLSLAYTLGHFANATDAGAQSYLRNGAGAPVFSGAMNIDGYAYSVAASSFSNTVYRTQQAHWMNSASIDWRGEAFRGRLVFSAYDFARDEQRNPSGGLPVALTGGAGSLARLDGSGWRTLDAQGRYALGPAHDLSFGLHGDRFELQNLKYGVADWTVSAPGALQTQARGKTQTAAVYVQDQWRLGPDLTLTSGVRFERWRAFDGRNTSVSPALAVSQPALAASRASPKASLEWRPSSAWTLTAAYGEAHRFPTVSELYQAVTTGSTLSVPNPDLRPERARSMELAAERADDAGRIRLAYFEEHLQDALISQSAPLAAGSSTLYTYVQNVDRVRARGLELTAERRDVLVRGLDLSGSVTWVDPRIVRDVAFRAAEGKRTPQIPRLRATAVATWRPDAFWTLTVAGRYSDRSYASIDNTDSVGHTYQGFEDYLVFDARVSRKLDAHWTAAVGVDNAGDESFYLFHPFPQRSVFAELNYRF